MSVISEKNPSCGNEASLFVNANKPCIETPRVKQNFHLKICIQVRATECDVKNVQISPTGAKLVQVINDLPPIQTTSYALEKCEDRWLHIFEVCSKKQHIAVVCRMHSGVFVGNVCEYDRKDIPVMN